MNARCSLLPYVVDNRCSVVDYVVNSKFFSLVEISKKDKQV